MSVKIFITGTDTDAGKTYVSVNLLNYFNAQGLATLGLKPISSGCTRENNVLYNADALALQKTSSIPVNYATINPILFEPPIAPHVAAQQIDYPLSVSHLLEKIKPAFDIPADVCLIEGAGGWRVPLNTTATESWSDFIKAAQLPVILVVGMKLGCINHAILTHEAIQKDGISILGWIANDIDPNMLYREESLLTLQKWLSSPYLGRVEHNASIITLSEDFHSSIFNNSHIAG